MNPPVRQGPPHGELTGLADLAAGYHKGILSIPPPLALARGGQAEDQVLAGVPQKPAGKAVCIDVPPLPVVASRHCSSPLMREAEFAVHHIS
jgi:hypothetical protein